MQWLKAVLTGPRYVSYDGGDKIHVSVDHAQCVSVRTNKRTANSLSYTDFHLVAMQCLSHKIQKYPQGRYLSWGLLHW